MTQSINGIFKRYPDQWLLIDVTQWTKATTPLQGKLIAHSKNRDDMYNKLLGFRKKNLPLLTHSSMHLPKGYALAL